MDGRGRRGSVHLGPVPKKIASSWQSRIEQLVASRISGVAMDTDLSVWVRGLPDASYLKLSRAGLVEPREARDLQPRTLSSLLRAFEERSSARQSTKRGFKQTLDSLLEHFGGETPVARITAEQADGWRVWIAADTKGSGNRKKKRTTGDNRLSPPTVAKRVSVAKQVFRCAVRWKWIDESPFDGLRPGSQANPARARYVPLATIRDVLDVCPSVEWKLMLALPRLAGLRCPSEVGSLRWDSVNWEKGQLRVLSKKTEHHGADHAVRIVPICPELKELLAEAFEAAEDGAVFIVPRCARAGFNPRTHLERLVAKAGHEIWPRLVQNLRASCETDWVERYPSHVVAKWLGHSPKVAAQHYLMSREHHFEDVVNGGDASPVRATRAGQPSADPCSANCSAPNVQIAVQHASASAGTPPHETTEPAATIEVAAGSSGIAPVTKTGLVAGTGFEPVTSRL
jgi:integrase